MHLISKKNDKRLTWLQSSAQWLIISRVNLEKIPLVFSSVLVEGLGNAAFAPGASETAWHGVSLLRHGYELALLRESTDVASAHRSR